ncbi:hypothetical protein ARAM_001601 [Aspergillus rambellii]|uniref:Carrier domain-containing protein n=1 Tax=Aspergillus rambellii TaxID=308745 RepID=A0A0F8USL9_9EURO|nr:hypothetical protein ARAM_001601 [Aspergillus rambellii]
MEKVKIKSRDNLEQSWLVTSSPSPFFTRNNNCRDHETLTTNESVSIPICRDRHSTPWQSILSVSWAILMAQYAGSTTVTLDTQIREPLAGMKAWRSRRIHTDPDCSIETMLDSVLEEHTKVDTNQPTDVVETSGAAENAVDQNPAPIQRVSMVMPCEHHGVNGIQVHGTETRVLPEDFLSDDEVLRVVVEQGASGSRLFCRVRYSTALGSMALASRVAHQFAHIAREITSQPINRKIKELAILSTLDRTTIAQWNAGSFAPISSCFHHLFAAQAQIQPDAPAVSAWDGELSYGELDGLSERLAGKLLDSGLRKGTIVPLLFEKSKWMVVSVLGVLKAGGACVGLCTSHPDSYIQGIIAQTGTSHVLSSSTQTGRLTPMDQAVWAVQEILEQESSSTNDRQVKELVQSEPQDLAFVIFTSGSTGKPKGALLTHESISTCAHYHGLICNVKPGSRILQYSSYAFDMSTIETWFALALGGCLCVPSESQRLWDLPAFIRDHRATWVFFTPTTLRSYHPGDLPGLENIVLGGENVTEDLVHQWQGHARLFDYWGPAECTGSAACEIVPDTWIPGTFGCGAGSRLWIVRPENLNQLAAVGTVGEVVVEGDIVAQGYLNDPVRTAEVFIDPPKWRSQFKQEVQGRLYKTGDLVQYNPDGTVRYVSRKDTVVKINGQRVDLDAVEVAIRTLIPDQQAAVDAVVIKGRNSRTDSVLLAFIETPAGADWVEDLATVPEEMRDPAACIAEATRLRHELLKSLPRFMVPSFIIPLTRIPLSATGKVDKKRLRASVAGMNHSTLMAWLNNKSPTSTPTTSGFASPIDCEAAEKEHPLTEGEHILLATVARVLGVEASTIDMDASFRQLGGDSVHAIQIARSVAQSGQTLRMDDILTGKWSLRELAQTVRNIAQTTSKVLEPFSLLHPAADISLLREEAAEQCQMSTKDIEDLYPCTPLQEGLLSLGSRGASNAYVDRFIFHLPEAVDLDRLAAAWTAVIDQLQVLRTRIIQSSNSQFLQVVVRQPSIWAEYTTVDEFMEIDGKSEMGFGTPLIRLSRIASEPVMLAITLHHAIYDGWTLSLLLRLVEQTYEGSPGMQPLAFSRFVERTLQQYDSMAMSDFWRREMADVQPITFPEYPSPDYYPMATTSLCRSLAAPVITATQSPPASPTTQLRLAWALLLSLYGGTDDVVFGSVIDGRRGDLPGIEAVAGPTICTVPVRTKIQRDMTVREATRLIEDSVSRTIPYEQYGLQNIARAGPDAAAACQFRSLLVVQPDEEILDSLVSGQVEPRLGAMHGFPGYAITLICHPKPDRWKLELLVDEKVVSSSQGSRILEQLDHILNELAQEDLQISDINLLCPGDQSQLSAWVHADVPEQRDCCIHDLFSQSATDRPHKIGIAAWDGDLTYSQLDQLSSAVAAGLMSQCQSENGTIAILLPRSRWVPVSMLGAMKTGRPFVMLERNQPVEHHQRVCRKVNATQIVAFETTVAQARSLVPTVYVVGPHIEDPQFLLPNGTGSSQCQAKPVTSQDTAYYVFTSGSTGEPKGVIIEHGQYASAIVAQHRSLHITAHSRVLHLSSYAFDSFPVEILTTLCMGGCVCIPSDEESYNEIARAVRRFQATWLVTTPSMLRLIEGEDLPSLRTLVAVGESMLPGQGEHWASRVQLLCGYGPTECCTGASAQPVSAGHIDVRNIGPGMGARLWLVHQDDHHTLVPVGTIGEIVIQGPIVGRGYLHDPEKSQDVFLETADWVASMSFARHHRLYKTGDLGYYNEDGTCTFLGRKSQQVKLRGQRLDLHLLEHHLRRLFGTGCIAIPAVIRPQGDQAHPVLVAMIHLPTDNGKSNTEHTFCMQSPGFIQAAIKARDVLQQGLPSVMVPSLFLQISQVPMLASGKVNRSALQRAAAAMAVQDLFGLARLGANSVEEVLNPDEDVARNLSQSLANMMHKNLQSPHDNTTNPVSTGESRPENDWIVGHNVSPAHLGLDSIDMVSFARLIAREYQLKIPATVLFQSTLTVRKIAEMISARENGIVCAQPDHESAPWWKHYQQLLASIDLFEGGPPPATLCRDSIATQPQYRPRRVFLTGGTGFLGSRILQQLVANPDVESVTVLVRGSSVVQAMARIIRSARLAQWWREEHQRVVHVWLGDLSRPNLGLSPERWAVLCGQSSCCPSEHFDAIIHNGALVHWVYDYDALQASNVGSTLQLLKALSTTKHPISFTYVSALRPGEDGIPEVGDVREAVSADVGYSQTKLVSELLIQRYEQMSRRSNVSFAIVRPGLMMGAASDGVANVNDVIWRTVSAAVNVNGFNTEEEDSWVYIAPVDWVATVVVHETIHTPELGHGIKVTAIEDGLHVKDFWRAIIKATSQALVPMDGTQWVSRIQNQIQTVGRQHPLWPVIDFFQATSGCIGSVLGDRTKPDSARGSAQSILWMTVLRNAQYLTSMGFWETTQNQVDHPQRTHDFAFQRTGLQLKSTA